MSQRQLAAQSGVNHSTISRLISDDRMPSLRTATKLARGLREIGAESEGLAYFAAQPNRTALPHARVERALRGDDALTEADVRELMRTYIGVRRRRVAARDDGSRGGAENGGVGAGRARRDDRGGGRGG